MPKMGVFVKYGLRKSSYVSKIPPVMAKNQIITVFVFLSTLQLTDLLFLKFPPPPFFLISFTFITGNRSLQPLF